MIEYIRLAIVFVAGVYLSDRIPPSFGFVFLLSLILVLTIKSVFKHGFQAKILIMSLAFVFGAGYCRYAQDTNRMKLSPYVNRYVTVTGRISEIPSVSEGNNHYTVTINEMSYNGGSVKTKEKLLLTAPSEFSYGDTVTFSGFVKKLPVKMNENGFDYARYYKTRGVFFKLYSSDAELAGYQIHDYSPYSLGRYLRCFVSDTVDRYYQGDYAAILKAVLTNNKKEFSEELGGALDRTGLARFYYPSYLHVMLFMTVITAALSFFDRKKRDSATVFLLIIYSLFNFGGFAMLRICIMLALLIFLKRHFGYVYYPDVIGMTALIIGVISPLAYFDAGFVMSALSCMLIYYFYDSVEKYFSFIRVKYIRRMVVISIICSVGLIPVSAYFWNGVSLHSICVSFIMLPCVGVILVLSPLFILLTAIFGSAPVIGWAMSAMAAVLKYIPLWADKAQFLTGEMIKPSLPELMVYFLLLTALVKRIKKKKRQMYFALFVAAALSVSVGIRETIRLSSIEMTFVNVGQGDGAIIHAPHRYTVLIDGGGGNAYSDYDPGEKLFLEYLRCEGITTVDSAFVSHYHKDHVQGIIAAINNLRVRNVFLPCNMEGSEWRTAIEQAAAEHGTKIHYLNQETLLTYNNGMTIRAIPPAKKTSISSDENDTTYVYHVTYGGFDALFTGDMSRFAEKNLIEIGNAPDTDLLKVTHHGSKTGTSAEWVEAVSPTYSVISVGENNTYNLPSRETLRNLEHSILYRTDYDGNIRFEIGKNGRINIKTFDRKE